MSSPVVPLALAGAALFLMSGGKSKKSKGVTASAPSYSLPPGTSIPRIYDAPTPPPRPTSGYSQQEWMEIQKGLAALASVRFNFQGREASLCSKCDPKGVDGKPGKNTKNAIKAFQALSGLSVTGEWGEREYQAYDTVSSSINAGKPIPCDPLLSYGAPLACFAQPDGSFGLMPSIDTSSSAPPTQSKPAPEPSDPTEPPPESSEYGPDELLVADGDCNLIRHQDDRFFDLQRKLIIESALEGLTDGQAADEIHEEMMRRYIPMCLFLGRDGVGQGVRTWWDTNLAHVFSALQSYELLPDTLEEDAIKHGLL